MNGDRLSAAFHSLRPTVWPFLWVHTFAGFWVAAGGRIGQEPRAWLPAVTASGVWAVLLGGAGAGLAARFQAWPDDGGDSVSVPGIIGPVCLAMLLLGLVVSPVVGWGFFDAYLVGLILTVLSTTPPIRLARFRAGALLLPALGAGLSFYAGTAVAVGSAVSDNAIAWLAGGFVLLCIAAGGLFTRLSSRLWLVLYAVALFMSVTVFAAGGAALGCSWKALALAAPVAAFWGWLGWRRFVGGRTLRGVLVAGAWLAADVALALAVLLSGGVTP